MYASNTAFRKRGHGCGEREGEGGERAAEEDSKRKGREGNTTSELGTTQVTNRVYTAKRKEEGLKR